MICHGCGKDDELRLGFCFDCASSGEARAAKRTVVQHIAKAATLLPKRKWEFAWFEATWAWQRLWRIGDYADGGTFDREGYDWR